MPRGRATRAKRSAVCRSMRFKHAEARELPQAAALGQLRFKHDCKLGSQALALRWLGASSLERARVSAVGDDARGGVKTRLRAAFSHFDAFRRISRDISRRRRVERAARRASRSDGALGRASRSGADAEGARARARGGREEKRERETRGGFVNRRENTK